MTPTPEAPTPITMEQIDAVFESYETAAMECGAMYRSPVQWDAAKESGQRMNDLKGAIRNLIQQYRDQELSAALGRIAELERDVKRYKKLRSVIAIGVKHLPFRYEFDLSNLKIDGNALRGSIGGHLDTALDAEIAKESP